MYKNKNILSILLTGILSMILLALIIVRTYTPSWILPKAGIPGLVLVSLTALLLEHQLSPNVGRNYLMTAFFSGLAFGVLPFAACFADGLGALKLALLGCVVFTVTTWLFDSLTDRLSTYPLGWAAHLLSALGLYLAAQCFGGLF